MTLRIGQLVVLLLSQAAFGDVSPLFDADDILEIELIGPLSAVLDDKERREERSFVLRTGGLEQSLDVRVRGKSRSTLCSFPPLRLNFSNSKASETAFAGQRKLKLVTHCQNRAAAQTNLLQEYAAYKIFNLLSDVSYRVRLLRIAYTDTEGELPESAFDQYGFVIESAAELAERVGGELVQETGVMLSTLDDRQAATVYIFQYLIGNTDWSLVMADEDDTCCHNGDLLDIDAARYFVPYDFDMSGLVNAGYARPDPSLRISRVTQRLYRGYCISTDALRDALSDVRAQRDGIMNVVSSLPELSQKEIDSTSSYLDKFYTRADNAEKLLQSFERRCL